MKKITFLFCFVFANVCFAQDTNFVSGTFNLDDLSLSLTNYRPVLEIPLVHLIDHTPYDSRNAEFAIFGYVENQETKDELFRKLSYFLCDFINEHPNLKVIREP